jgi:hypothetical protein
MTEQPRSERKIKDPKIVEVNCPSPLDLKSNGVVKVIVVGKKGFRIGRIDPMSTRLEGVAPLGFAIEDVAAPINGRSCAKRHKQRAKVETDGIDDLALEFNTQEVAQALGDLNGDSMAVLELTGKLKDGTPILGEDIVVIENEHAK